MQNRKIVLLVLILLVSSLACRAVTGLNQTEPTVPSALAPLASVTTAPTSLSGQEAVEPSPDPEAAATLTQATPRDLEAALTGIPALPMGTPFADDSYKSVPVLPGAYNATETEGALTFFSAQPAEEVLAYYQEAMPLDGWQFLGGETESQGGAVVIFTEGDKMATISIMPNPSGGNDTMVIIVVP